MLPVPSVARRTRCFLLALVVAFAGLVGLQGWQPTPAAAAPPSTPSPSPSAASRPSAGSSPAPASTPSASPSPAPASTPSANPSPRPASTPSPDPSSQVARAVVAGPTAVDDVLRLQALPYISYNNVPFAANDQAGAAPLKLASTTFPDSQPGGGTVSADHQLIGFGDLGFLHMLPPSNRMEWYGFGPPGTAVARYRVVDANGATADALVTVVIGPGGSPHYLAVRQSFEATLDELAYDIPGRNADATPGAIDRTSVHFTASSGGPGSTVSADGRTLTDPVRGVFRADPVTGVVTYDPKNTYRGWGEYVSYVARDTTRAADGSVKHHSYRLRIYLQVTPIDPQPVQDVGSTPYRASLTLPGVTDDRPGDPTAPLRPELTVFVTSGYYLPPGSTLHDDGHGLEVAGEGSWTIDAPGTITFTPLASFSGRASVVYYQLTDVNSSTARGYEQVWVAPGPVARSDTATTAQNVDVLVDVPANDTPGKNADGKFGAIDRTTVHFASTGQPTGATLSTDDRTLTVPREGVWTVDPTTGTVGFDPDPHLSGRASPVRYTVQDTVRRTDGRLVHNLALSAVTITVTPIVPVAVNNWVNTTFGRSVEVPVLGNDRPGAASAPLVPASVRLRLGPGLPSSSTLSADGRTLVVTGRGTYVARADGVVVVTPAPGFTGVVPTVGYTVSDANGTTASATVTVAVTGAAVLRPTRATTRAGQPVIVDALSNDDPPAGAGWDRSSVCVVAGASCLKHAVRPGVASWTVDPEDGTITFASAPGFLGDVTVSYRVHDTVVGTYTSTLTVSVAPAREAQND